MDFANIFTFILTTPYLLCIFVFFFFLPIIYLVVLMKRDNPQKYFKHKKCIDFSAKTILFLMPFFFMATEIFVTINDIEIPKDFLGFSVMCQVIMSFAVAGLAHCYDKKNEKQFLEKIEELEKQKNSN